MKRWLLILSVVASPLCAGWSVAQTPDQAVRVFSEMETVIPEKFQSLFNFMVSAFNDIKEDPSRLNELLRYTGIKVDSEGIHYNGVLQNTSLDNLFLPQGYEEKKKNRCTLTLDELRAAVPRFMKENPDIDILPLLKEVLPKALYDDLMAAMVEDLLKGI